MRIARAGGPDGVRSHIPPVRPGEARALQVADYRDGWLHVNKATKSKSDSAEIRGTKTGKPKRLPVSEELVDWIGLGKHADTLAQLKLKLKAKLATMRKP